MVLFGRIFSLNNLTVERTTFLKCCLLLSLIHFWCCNSVTSVEEEERMIGFALFSHVANVLWLQSSTKNIKKMYKCNMAEFLFVCSYKINCIRFRSLYIINLVQQPRFFHSKWTKRQETDHENQIKVCKVLIWSHFWFYWYVRACFYVVHSTFFDEPIIK